MRVISGSAKGAKLLGVDSKQTRPILDRVKESLFNIIANLIEGANVMDMFAGTGSLGIEALSRGAAGCLFIESDYGAIKIVKQNLTKTRLIDKADIIESDVFTLDSDFRFQEYVQNRSSKFDLVLVGAPYPLVEQASARDKLISLFNRFAVNQVIADDGVIVLQHKTSKLELPNENRKIEITDERVYGKTQLTFFRPVKYS